MDEKSKNKPFMMSEKGSMWFRDEEGTLRCYICKEEALFRADHNAFCCTYYAYPSCYCPHCGKEMESTIVKKEFCQ